MTTLYLTPAERKLFDRLSKAVKEQWAGKVEEEKGTAWETEEHLITRLQHLPFSDYPKTKAFAERLLLAIQSGADIESLGSELPSDALPLLFYMLGARGMSVLVAQFLSETKSNDDLEDLAALTSARHAMLKSNALVFAQS